MEILAIIPARGGSKGIPYKNSKLLGGKPLLGYTAEAAKKSLLLSRIILSTEDPHIADIGISYGLEVPFLRPKILAQDDTPSIAVFQHLLEQLELMENYKPDIVLILQPTSPFRNASHIDEAIRMFLDCDVDSLVSVMQVPHNMIPESVMMLTNFNHLIPYMQYDEKKNSRQLKPKYYCRNGAAIYIMTRNCLMEKGSLFGNATVAYFMDKISSIDIDDMEDWIIAESILQKKECL